MARLLLTAAAMSLRMLLLLLGSSLVACSGADARSIDLLSNGDGGTGADTGSVVPIGDGGNVVDNGGTVAFAVAKAFLSRGQWCGDPPPFTSADSFALVLVGPGTRDPLPTIRISVNATAPVALARPLTIVPWKPAPAPKPGENDDNTEEAYAQDAHENVPLAFSLARGMTTDRPDPNPYDQATLTVLAIPQKEHDTLQVRVQLHFTDGATLDQTFVAPLDETVTPCGGR